MTLSLKTPTLFVKLLNQNAIVPKRGSKFAAGYDLYSAEEVTVQGKSRALIDTGIAISLPEGTYGRIAPRSGLAVKNFIDVGAGVIDVDYRAAIKVLIFNFGDDEFKVKSGDRIAQLIVEKIENPNVIIVEELDETERGEKGFGSTGV